MERPRPPRLITGARGWADPRRAVHGVKGAGLAVDAIMTVVDALDGPRHLRETRVAKLQIEGADFLVLNKVDLVDAGAADQLERRLAKANPRAERFRTVRGVIDSDVLFATGVAAFRDRARRADAGEAGHLHAHGVASFRSRSAGGPRAQRV